MRALRTAMVNGHVD